MFLKTGTRAISLYAKTKPNPDISMTRAFQRPTYTLENLEPVTWLRHVIPARDERECLRAGDLAKLHFQFEEQGEWMWVEVIDCDGAGEYLGVLRNEPAWVPAEFGDRVRFRAEHIRAIERAKVLLQ